MISFSLHPRTRIFKEHSNHSTATNNLTRERKTVALLATDGTDWEEKDTAIDFLMKSSGAALPIAKVGKSIKGALLAVGSAGRDRTSRKQEDSLVPLKSEDRICL